MAEIISIVAQSKNRVIGRGNQMPWHLPRDLAHFKEKTMGFPVIMGRKTFNSIGRVLPYRRNIILSRDKNFVLDNVETFPDIKQALLSTEKEEKVFIIGGGQIYQQTLPLVTTIFLTEVDVVIPDGEAFFPSLSPTEWRLKEKTFYPPDEKNHFAMTFCHYERILT